METPTHKPSRVTFGRFQADLSTGELWKGTYRVKLQGQPFKVLALLVERAGEIVSREDLQLRVWGPDTIVDFEQSLGAAVKKVRDAIGDSADNPRFIETLPRRGFRFIAPVLFLDTTPVVDEPATVSVEDAAKPILPAETTVLLDEGSEANWLGLTLVLLVGVVGLGLGGVLYQWGLGQRPVALPRVVPITRDGLLYTPTDNLLGSLSASVTDGAHLYTPTNKDGQIVLSQISVTSGAAQTVMLPSEIAQPEAEDVSPDGTRLLVRSNLASTMPQPLWVVNVDGSSAARVSNILVQDAIWMPDGKGVLYTTGGRISVVSLEDGRSTLLTTVTQLAVWPRWSPDGSLLRFTELDPVSHASSLWELPLEHHVPHLILNNPNASVRTCCGIWTADGKTFVFERTKDGDSDLWSVNASFRSTPLQITNGPLEYMAPSAGRNGEQVYFVGKGTRSLLERYNPVLKEYAPEQNFLAEAERVRYSRDGLWVAWVGQDHHLWRARADGSDKLSLTPSSLRVFMANWSPDDTQLAFMGRISGQPWQIYRVNADGSPPEVLFRENQNLGDPSFSPDGRSLVFGTVAELMGEKRSSRHLELMDLSTRHVSQIAHSEGLFSPAWSPDGHFIAAITVDQNRLMLYDTRTSLWKILAVTSASWPIWSKDSKAIYVHAYQAEGKPILRISVADGETEIVTDLRSFHVGTSTHAAFAGLTAADVPLMNVEIADGNLYSLDLTAK